MLTLEVVDGSAPAVGHGKVAFLSVRVPVAPMQMGFCLPSVIPVVVSNFNWTPVMVGLILGAVLMVWYLPVFGARHWYHGKAHLSEDTSVVSLHMLFITACLKLPSSDAQWQSECRSQWLLRSGLILEDEQK